ncbi:uncharacterized protein LOC126905071 [Daktulosphaira vitifoliae]|uniref:uncharacterized protein LOC126905071 n=1 Tax=Daktulosphaira vitifoliae TaxID=58002 RepID=UPI0021AADB96|nr:uncharacterized protein LOC126905071 [Daktulosphaira vitifoliae]
MPQNPNLFRYDNYVNNFLVPPADPIFLPVIPQYEVDVHDHQAKFFNTGFGVTKYQTIFVRETVRPVCLLVERKVPSCDHYSDYDYPYRPKSWLHGTNRDADVDLSTYLIDPSRPHAKIEITDIPFRGPYLLFGATVTLDEEEPQKTPPLEFIPVNEDVKDERFLRQIFLTSHKAAEVTIGITEIQKVIDDKVEVTLVPKNCIPNNPKIRKCKKNSSVIFNSDDVIKKINLLMKDFTREINSFFLSFSRRPVLITNTEMFVTEDQESVESSFKNMEHDNKAKSVFNVTLEMLITENLISDEHNPDDFERMTL